MKTIPILFSTEMVQAILAGNKTQTRRVVKPEPKKIHAQHADASITTERIFAKGDGRIHCPYGKPGDILWVRETWAADYEIGEGCRGEGPSPYYYKASDQHPEINGKWKPSIFMPKAACRIFLKIKSVRVERLNDISEKDAKAEGVKPDEVRQMWLFGLDAEKRAAMYLRAAIRPFKDLWQKINGPDSWDSNPFVWVVEFEKIDKPEGF